MGGVIDKTTLMLAFFKNGGLQNMIYKFFEVPIIADTDQIFFAGHSSVMKSLITSINC